MENIISEQSNGPVICNTDSFWVLGTLPMKGHESYFFLFQQINNQSILYQKDNASCFRHTLTHIPATTRKKLPYFVIFKWAPTITPVHIYNSIIY